MLGYSRSTSAIKRGQTSSAIDQTAEFLGEMHVPNCICIDGRFEGNLKVGVKFVLAANGLFVGELQVADAEIHGTFRGRIRATGQVILRARSTFHGELDARNLVLEEGACFESTCNIGGESVHAEVAHN